VSGLILPDSVPGRVLEAIRRGAVTPVASWALASEIADVLRRPRIRRYGIVERDVEDVLLLLAPFLPGVEVEVQIRDPADAPVIAAAVAGKAEAIVSGDGDLVDDEVVRAWLLDRAIEVLTPAELLARIAGA
jgi:putative PIN family toxin of toxin-antitoxin system